MTRGSVDTATDTAGAATSARSSPTARAGYAACAWALLFAAANVYWGLGGRFACPLPNCEAAFSDPSLVALNRLAVVLKVGLALVALATVQSWGRVIPRWALLGAAWGLGAGMTAYGGLGLVLDVLRALGVTGVPESGDWTAFRWHLLLWDPWWLLGGLLFVAAARHYQRRHMTGQSRPGEAGVDREAPWLA